jgi:hypothetical protein
MTVANDAETGFKTAPAKIKMGFLCDDAAIA